MSPVRPVSRRQAVLHYVQRWLPPSEQFVHGLVSRSRHPAVVVSRDEPEHLDRFPVARLSSPARALRLVPESRQRSALTGYLLGRAVVANAGLVHVHFGYRVHDVAGLVRRRGLPLVVSLHGHDVTAHRSNEAAAALALADAVVVPSGFLADAAVAAGVERDRIEVIPAGVDTDRFAPSPLPDGAPEVVFAGRFVEKKGLDVLLAAWPAVRSTVPDARLRLLGYGPLEDLARRAGRDVEVVLEPGHAEVGDAIRRARLVVSPSRTAADGDAESLLLVNLEAQASGRPVVTTRHGGIPEFVRDGETAILVPEGDPHALAEAMIAVLADDALATRLAAAGPGWAGRFDVATCAARHDDLYDRLLAGTAVPGSGR